MAQQNNQEKEDKNASDEMIDSLAEYLYDRYEIFKKRIDSTNIKVGVEPWSNVGSIMKEKWKIEAIGLINRFDKLIIGH